MMPPVGDMGSASQQGQTVAQSMAEAGGPWHCWGPLGTPWLWQSQLHRTPVAMAVLLCLSMVAVEGSWSAQSVTVMEGNGPA